MHFVRNLKFFGDQLYYVRRTKTALTASHRGTGATLDAVHITRAGIAMNRRNNLALGDFLAATDHIGKGAVL